MDHFETIKSFFNTFFGGFPIPVFLCENKQKMVNANQKFLDLIGRTVDELPILSLDDFLKNPLRFLSGDPVFNDLNDRYLNELICSNEKTIPVALCSVRLERAEGEDFGYLFYVIDLSAEADLKEKNLSLAIKNKVLQEQAGNLASAAERDDRKGLEHDLVRTNVFLENVIESCGDGIFLLDGRGIVSRTNRAFCAVLGKSQAEIVGRPITELGPVSKGTFEATTGETITLDQEYLDYTSDQLARCMNLEDHETIENWEYYAFHRDGSLVPLELTTTVERNTKNQIVGAVCTARDLTNRRRAEKQARDSRDFLELVIEASYDGIIVSDMNNICLLMNSAAENLLGRSKQELLGSRVQDLVEMEVLPEKMQQKRIEDLWTTGHSKYSAYLRRKDGATVYVDYGVTLVAGLDADHPLIVYILCDITEKRKSELELIKSREAVLEASRSRTRFFSNITHEFRTPLTLAIGPLEGLLRGEFGPVEPEIKDQVRIALQNSRQLLKLVNHLLDISMLGSTPVPQVCERRDLPRFVSAVLETFSFIAGKKKITLKLNVGDSVPPVMVDPVKLEKVLFDLIGNAFQRTPERGRIVLSIEAPKERPNGAGLPQPFVRLKVRDSGPVLNAEDIAHAFDLLTHSRSGPIPGTGLGLVRAREMVELMNGQIAVRSEKNGAAFVVAFPAADPAEGNTDDDFSLVLQSEVEMADIEVKDDLTSESVTGNRELVLVVDDNPTVRKYVVTILKKDYDFAEARNGLDALKKLEQYTPDLILCDIMMPEMDGYAFLERVKSNPDFSHIPFVFLTAKASTDKMIEGLNEGADDYIVKPFNSLELLARVRAMLRLRSLMRSNQTQNRKISQLTIQLEEKYRYGDLIGRSEPMRRIYQLLETIRESESTVLISGETGTGKEVIANAIHYGSPRRKGPMVSVNCGAIPRELMEREFFGHVKGAYTGAVSDQSGYFEAADGGTLFLDEIGEMDRDMQVKLLRVLERGEIVRVGESVPTRVNVRMIAATNKDLQTAVRVGTFREDLYYRIYVLPVQVPPLRDRREDIPLLVEHFMEKMKKKMKKRLPRVTEKEMRQFMSYGYPGNVRELEHLVERFCLFDQDLVMLFQDLSDPCPENQGDVMCYEFLKVKTPLKEAAKAGRSKAERELILHTLRICNNDYAATAERLNIGRSSFYNKIKEYGIKN